jgi:hypothetical protein
MVFIAEEKAIKARAFVQGKPHQPHLTFAMPIRVENFSVWALGLSRNY